MPRPLYKLRGKIQEEGYEISQLTKVIDKSASYVSSRMNLKKPWTIEEIVKISKFLGIEDTQAIDYFTDMKD